MDVGIVHTSSSIRFELSVEKYFRLYSTSEMLYARFSSMMLFERKKILKTSMETIAIRIIDNVLCILFRLVLDWKDIDLTLLIYNLIIRKFESHPGGWAYDIDIPDEDKFQGKLSVMTPHSIQFVQQ